MLEVIALDINEVKFLKSCGIKNVELISHWELEGLTPDWDFVKQVLELGDIQPEVMIRPHGKSFYYDEKDQVQIFKEINVAKELGVKHIVFGCLTKDNKIDLELLYEVIKAKGEMKLTFHRAIEDVEDYMLAVGQVAEAGVDYILTSGQDIYFGDALNKLNWADDILLNYHTEILFGGGMVIDKIAALKENGFKNWHVGSAMRIDNVLQKELIEKFIKANK